MNNVDPFVRYSVKTLYHFTDRRNLPSIRQLGGLFSFAKLEEKQIANLFPGGNKLSLEADKQKSMDRYVHLCFTGSHPMEFLAKKAKHIEETTYLHIDSAVLKIDGVMYSAGVSNKTGVEIYPLEEAKKHIDFEALFKYVDWRANPAFHQRRKDAEKCEILVPDHVPIHLIRNIPNG
jgi:hypothetical protein